MPDYFKFKRDDEYIRGHLTPTEINGVRKWQSDRLDYEFSFHDQHELGWPVYIIEPGKRGQRNRPKLNLKVPDYLFREGSFEDNRAGIDAKDTVRQNITLFQKMAQLYYQGQEEQRPVLDATRWLAEYRCPTPSCRGRKITQGISAAVKVRFDSAFFGEMVARALGKCKQCRQKAWQFVAVRQANPNERPDIAEEAGELDQI